MSSTQVSKDTATEASAAAAVPLRLEVVVMPVADVDGAKSFYQGLGWRLDGDVAGGDGDLGDGFDPGSDGRAAGPDPEGRCYCSYGSFTDPDGNRWLPQEVKERLPGRVGPADVACRAQLLHETAEHHDSHERVAAPHDWWDWYAAYMVAREDGSSPDEASAAAGRYMADVRHVVVPSAT
jgi:catechol 2,3-dioxygenase-like lactoylglutathione lyase family enzyme